MMRDWLLFIAAAIVLVVGADWLIQEIRECRARGGVLVEFTCVKKI